MMHQPYIGERFPATTAKYAGPTGERKLTAALRR
jgi:hypothetical protein